MKTVVSFLVCLLMVQYSYSQKFKTIQHIQNYHIIELEKTNSLKVERIVEEVDDKVVDCGDKITNKTDALSLLSSRLPLNEMSLTSRFGYRTHPVTGNKNTFHSGIDLIANSDTVYSILHGTVIAAGYDRLLGIYVKIKHGNYNSVIGHLSTRFVTKGDLVPVGFPLGITGKSGRVTGEHLHFTIRYKGEYINPLPFLASIISLKGQSLLTAIGLEEIPPKLPQQL